jgi:hypothetical protein
MDMAMFRKMYLFMVEGRIDFYIHSHSLTGWDLLEAERIHACKCSLDYTQKGKCIKIPVGIESSVGVFNQGTDSGDSRSGGP